MNEWMNEWTNEWTNERMNEWMNEYDIMISYTAFHGSIIQMNK